MWAIARAGCFSSLRIGARIVFLATMISLLTPRPGSTAPLSQTGRWWASDNWGFSGTHVAVQRKPGTDSATVFLFGESGTNQTMKYWRFRPANTVAQVPNLSQLTAIPHPNDHVTDLFCSGHATLADGKLLLLGGGWIPSEPCEDVYSFDPSWTGGMTSSPWTDNAEMAVNRWYGTATALADGGVLASAGTMSSLVVGFGGADASGNADRVLHPLELSGRFGWSDTLAVPGQLTTPQPPLSPPDDYTNGNYPPGRQDHAFVADYSGRGVLYGGRRKRTDGTYEVLSDIWLLRGSIISDDSTHAWHLMEQMPDPTYGLPVARWGCAATWAGVENRDDTKIPDTTGTLICYVHGGVSAVTGQALGDLWRGERRQGAWGQHYRWYWKRILADDPARARYGHSMVFDPGPPGGTTPGAAYAQLLIYGGRTSTTPPAPFADNTHLYAFGVGSISGVGAVWRELTPDISSAGAPPAREGQALTFQWRQTGESYRNYFMFGGKDQAGALVSSDLWHLSRSDPPVGTVPGADMNGGYKWDKMTPAAGSPAPRTRAAMAYNDDGGVLVVVGGDKDSGGITGEIWSAQVLHPVSPTVVNWAQPAIRTPDFHPAPPPLAGMAMFAIGPLGSRITRSLERFTPNGSSPPGGACTEALAGQWQTVSDPVPDSERPIGDYPYMFQLPDGRMFYAGPAPVENPVNAYRRFYDLTSRRWSDTTTSGNQDAQLFGSAVMYRPGQILRAGTHGEGQATSHGISTTETISIGAGTTPAWVSYDTLQVGHPKLLERTNHNLTLLPTGDVLASGGLGVHAAWPDPDTVKQPQIWKVAKGAWSDFHLNKNEWLASDPYTRNYHSTAILLPDARVLTTGGEHPNPNENTASLFEPPYLFRQDDSPAQRPQLTLAPGYVTYGRTFTITLSQPSNLSTIRSVALMRPGAVTHGFDQNQHYVPLTFATATSPTRLLVQAPADASTTPPGDYMLFVVDSLGTDAPAVPSVAWWTRAGTFTPQPDSADVTPPGTVVDLSGCPHADQSSGELSWTESADDWFIAASGRPVSYDLRYKIGSTSPDTSDWATGWTTASCVSCPLPGTPGGYLTIEITGLSPETKYWFRLRTNDDNGHASALSNAALIWTKSGFECAGGSFAGGGGGGLSVGRVARTNSLSSVGSADTYENSLLDAGPRGLETSDALRLPVDAIAGTHNFWFRTHAGHATAFDRARLLVVEHSAEQEAYVADTAVVAGTRVAIVGASFTDGRAFGPQLETAAGGTLRALPGDTLDLDLGPTAGRVLVIEGRSLGGRGAPEAMGFDVELPLLGGGWSQVAHACMRQSADRVAVRGISGSRVRLVFTGGAEITSLGSLAPGAANPSVSVVAVLQAQNTFQGDLTTLAAAADGAVAWLADRDTLQLAFDLPAGSADYARDVFLEVTGAPVTPGQAQASRARQSGQQPQMPPLAFALHQSQPNPGFTSTEIAFELPERLNVRLEIYDSQGRRVREFAGRYDAGLQRILWDLRTNRGRRVPPGIYAYRLVAGAYEARRKLVVVP